MGNNRGFSTVVQALRVSVSVGVCSEPPSPTLVLHTPKPGSLTPAQTARFARPRCSHSPHLLPIKPHEPETHRGLVSRCSLLTELVLFGVAVCPAWLCDHPGRGGLMVEGTVVSRLLQKGWMWLVS